MQIKNKKDTWLKASQTSPIYDDYKRDKRTNMAIPSDSDVKREKDWGEANEL